MEILPCKRIVFIASDITPLMIKKDPFQIPYELAQLGFNVTVVTSYDSVNVPGCQMQKILKRTIMSNIIKSLSLPTYITNILLTITSVYNVVRTLSLISRMSTDIVLTYYYPLYIVLLGILKIKSNYKIICKMDWDGIIRGSMIKRLLRKIGLYITLRFCDAIIIESYEAYLNVYKEIPHYINRTYVIWNGFDNTIIKYCADNKDRKKQILCVSRIVPVKGIHDLIIAFHRVVKKFNDWRLIIVGPIYDTQYFKYLQTLIKRLKLEKYVTFQGLVSDEHLAHLYSESSIFVLPSYLESFGIARVEAMACGLPIITTATGGSEIVKGVGFIVRPGNINSLAEALEKLMGDNTFRNDLSMKAIMRAKELTWKNIVQKYVKIMERLCSA